MAGILWLCLLTRITALAQSNSNPSPVSILTHHYDNARSGLNANETVLNPANVNTNSFGLLFSYAVDGHVYAEPLYVPEINIPGQGTHNVVFVATQHNTVYAFDADSNTGTNGGLLWQTNLGTSAKLPTSDFGTLYGGDIGIDVEVGVTGTPVIDPDSGTLFVDAFTHEGSSYYHRLHALNITNGTEQANSPALVAASVPGTGDGSANGVVSFNPTQHIQRPALTLAGGVLYVAYAGYADTPPYHGWVIGFNPSTLQQLTNYTFNTTPNGGDGGLWMSGSGFSVDANTNLYFEVGNGTFDADTAGGQDYGDSFVKLSTAVGLSVADYFTPFDQDWLSAIDLDLGSGGPLLLPDSVGTAAHPHLMVGCGKEGTIYLLDRDSLGQYNPDNNSQIVQELPQVIGGTWSSPLYFNNCVFYQGYGDSLKSFQISNGLLSTAPVSQALSTVGYPPGTPVVSANGTNNAIIWLLQTDSYPGGQAILHAYNPYDLTQEFYNSSMAAARDNPGAPIKFSVPTVANGKVYVGAQYAVSVFGNLTVAPQIAPAAGVFTNSVTVTLSDATLGASIYYTLDNSTPTTNSILYTGPFTLSNSLTVIAKAFSPGAADSPVTSATFLSSAAIGQGIGLTGAYYANQLKTFNAPATLVRIDPTISFNWSNSYPDPSVSSGDYTVQWVGSLLAQFNETYTFYATASDGVRLWVNNQLIIDGWQDQPPTEWSGSLPVVAGQRYNLRMEYYEDVGQGVALLSWASPSTAKATIPQSQLYPTNQPPPTLSFSGPTNGAIFLGTDSITLNADAAEDGGTILSVDFFANGAQFASISNSPYALSVLGLPVGSYALSAQATDAAGITTTSSVVNVFVVDAFTPAQLAISPGLLNFGWNALGTAMQASLLITNAGTAPIANGAAVLDGGPFAILSGSPFNLSGFGSTNLLVQFSPTNEGAFSNSVIVTSDNAGSSTNAVIGFGAIPPAASFSGIPTSGAAPLAVAFTDSSRGDITNHFWDFGDGSSTNTAGTNITHIYASAATNTVMLTASGPVGTSTQKLIDYVIVTNPPPLLVLNPTNLDFGTVVIGQTNLLLFQVINQGGMSLTGTVTGTAPFSISAGSPFSVDPGQTGLVSVACSPSDTFIYSNVVVFASNGGNSTNAVTGIGLTPAQLTVSPALLNLGFTAVGGAVQASLLVTNLGGAALSNGVALLDNGPFTIVSGTPFALEGFGSTNIVVQFSPTNVGTFSNLLAITTANAGASTNIVIGSAAVPPNASFVANPSSGGVPLTVSFTDNSTGTIANHFWDFGDGSTTNIVDTNVTHLYTSVGTNTVSLTVSGPVGSSTVVAYVVISTPAQLGLSPGLLSFGFTAVGSNAQASLLVTNLGGAQMKNGLATLDNGPFTLSSAAAFNLPGFGSTNIVVQFSPTSEGTFTNYLTITTENGGASTNLVTGLAAVPPNARFVGAPTSGGAPLAVAFVDNSTGTITNRFWDWGDGSASNTTVTTVLHTYFTPGTNAVALTVSGPLGTNLVSVPGYIIVTNLGPVTITILRSTNQVQLLWPAGTLQSANSANGGYTDLTNALSPYNVPTSAGAQYFRVRIR